MCIRDRESGVPQVPVNPIRPSVATAPISVTALKPITLMPVSYTHLFVDLAQQSAELERRVQVFTL